MEIDQNNREESEYMSSRRRRRLNQIVPNPRKPRTADYVCSLCGETYQVTVEANPWWAVYRHECPHCKQHMIPRIDISVATNAIELDPNVIALYGEGIDDSGEDGGDDDEYSDEEGDDDLGNKDAGAGTVMNRVEKTISHSQDAYDGDGGAAGGRGMQMLMMVDDQITDAFVNANGGVKKAAVEEEEKIFDDDGLLNQEEASRLLVLMCHARGCNGMHSSTKHTEICKSTKFLMLHIRDCKGIDIHGRECLFPWCKPCKKMLKHLTQCYEPNSCAVCNPW
jgi:transcription elongation factor Elf1